MASGKTTCWVLKHLPTSATIHLQALLISCRSAQNQVFFCSGIHLDSWLLCPLTTDHSMLGKQSCFLDSKRKWARKPDYWRRKGAKELQVFHSLSDFQAGGSDGSWLYWPRLENIRFEWKEEIADDGLLKIVTLAFRSNHVHVCRLK